MDNFENKNTETNNSGDFPQPLPDDQPLVVEYKQPVIEQRPLAHEQPTAEQSSQVHVQPITEQQPQVHAQPITEQQPQVHAQPITEQPSQVYVQPITEQTPQVCAQPIAEQQPQVNVRPIAEQSPLTYEQPKASVFEPAGDARQNDAGNFGTEIFYKETIKDTPRKQKRRSFMQTVAIVCIISLLGGSSVGFSIGAGSLIAKDYFIPLLRGEMGQSLKGNDSTFDFDESGIFKEIPSANKDAGEQPEVADAFVSAQNAGVSDESVKSYADIINKVEPSVVCVSSKMTQGDNFGFGFGAQESTGLGTGILFFESDTKYYIVTNYHVIQNAVDVTISITDSEPIPAHPVGSDANNDLAVISIAKEDAEKAGVNKVTLATFGNSDSMQVGDMVLAIGNAMGEGNTATNGIISAKDKTITVKGTTLTVLQTNAAINPGNSGGPLVNLKGEVIGINTAKIGSIALETTAEGMGYSIPSNIAKPIIQGFMDSINKPYMGVQIATLTSEMAMQFNLPSAGAIVESVVKDSPADRAGIQRLDIITGFNGEPILTAEQLTESVKKSAIGDEVEIKLLRNGKESLTIKVSLEQRQ